MSDEHLVNIGGISVVPLPPRPLRKKRSMGVNSVAERGSVEEETAKFKYTNNEEIFAKAITKQYEYLDHTADVQLHAWDKSIERAFEQVVIAMFGYITDIDCVDVKHGCEFEVIGHDLHSLLFNYLDEFLYRFSTDDFICVRVKVLALDTANFVIKVKAWGDFFSLDKHEQGTEVKAITYSNMQVNIASDRTDIFVIIDI